MIPSELAYQVVQAVERRLTGSSKPRWRATDAASRSLWQPTKLVASGSRRILFSWTALACMALAGAFIYLMYYLVRKGQLDNGLSAIPIANGIALCGIVIPAFLILFALPSSYGTGGATPGDARFVTELLVDVQMSDPRSLDMLRKCIQLYGDHARTRVTLLKYGAGLLWAGFAYVLIKGVEGAVAHNEDSLAFPLAAGAAFAAAAASWWTLAYEVAVDRMFSSIELGLNDYSASVQPPAAKEA
jgi:hypothetical protein